MFEGAIAAFLNRLLGKYIEDLDTEELNVGIFSGDICLTDLKLKPEALYQLGLPVRIRIGIIGKIILKIPWAALFSQPIVLCIEDVYAIAASSMQGPYNAEEQKRLMRAEKKKILEDLEDDETSKSGLSSDLFDSLVTSVIRNFQITINNVHIRYEEQLSPHLISAFGVCIQSISMTTTNNKWKPGICAANSEMAYQLIRAESFSIYIDYDAEPCLASYPSTWDISSCLTWKNTMYRALQTFGMKDKEFQFLLKPFTAKIKVIIYKGSETQSSRMLVDIVLQDVAMQISEMQYITFCRMYDSLLCAAINRPYRKYRPDKAVNIDPLSWWRYAYVCILEHKVRPYYWWKVAEHRKTYRNYKETYSQTLLKPNDTELKLDLQKYEDNLTILNIVIAREHAKQELKAAEYERQRNKIKTDRSIQENKEDTFGDYEKVQNVTTSSNDRDNRKLHRLVENGPGAKIKLEKLIQPTDYKYNFTLANCSLSLFNKDKEVLVITIAQFLTSIESQPISSAFKISARAESFVIEGASSDGDLIPLITVNNVLTGNISTNFLAIDFAKNGLNVDPNFEISAKLEAIEVTYHHYAMMEVAQLLKCNEICTYNTSAWMHQFYCFVKSKFLGLVSDTVSQTLRIAFKIDIKGPYIVFPEYGTIEKGGHILLLDLGSIMITNELQAPTFHLEDATLMEMEELLYDRIHVTFNGAQVLFCHSGDDWRMTRKKKDSECHFIPKIQANMTFSYSIKPEYRQLPRIKLNMSISSMKFNLSENKLQLIIYFLNSFKSLSRSEIKMPVREMSKYTYEKRNIFIASITDLKNVRSKVCLPPAAAILQTTVDRAAKKFSVNNVPKLDRNVVSSEVSEEDLELLAKSVHLSGFDDSISPCNHINLLFRFAIGEVSLNFASMISGKEQPYLNLRLHTLYLETAIMEYGPAVQFGIGSILLVDKTNVGVSGSYLELISTGDTNEVFFMSYRKVRSDCPDFKSHFKTVEHSFIICVVNVNIVFHKTALSKAKDYYSNLQRVCSAYSFYDLGKKIYSEVTHWNTKENDPPIPAGAIKLAYSARLGSLSIRFCDKDYDLMDVKIWGLENDCAYKANERMVLRAHLRNILIEDLDDNTLYTKILSTDEDRVFDMKYVRHTPKLYVCSDIDTNKDDVMSDGSFKLSIGRINCLLISRILTSFYYFINPFTPIFYPQLKRYLKNKFTESIEGFKRSAIKLHIFIDIQGPVFLLPQTKFVPNLLVFDTGLLSVENFFKKIVQSSQHTKTLSNDNNHCIIDNILLELKSITIFRAIITLRGDLGVQEPIIEPIHIHFDIKRKTEYRNMTELTTYGLFSIQGAIDFVNINLSQQDFKSIILVWRDNISRIVAFQTTNEHEDPSLKRDLQDINGDDGMVKKLEVFLAHNEAVYCEINMKLILEGLQLNLFFDSEEVLSSPVRDLNHGLCKLCFGEIINVIDFYNDKSLKIKLSLQSLSLQDTRRESTVVKKIIQSPARLIGTNLESCISVSMSPIFDMTYNRAPTGDECYDILIQDIRINWSLPFLIPLVQYIVTSLPSDLLDDELDEGIINHGYESINHITVKVKDDKIETEDLKSTQYYQDRPETSVSLRIQKPELMLFGNLAALNARIILVQAEITLESSTHNGVWTSVCTYTDVRAKSKDQGRYSHKKPRWLLNPCDIEIYRKEDMRDHNVEVTFTISPIDVHLSAEIMHTFLHILTEIDTFCKVPKISFNHVKMNYYDTKTYTDLWTPKKILSIPYKPIDNGNSMLNTKCNEQLINAYLKPVLTRLWIEMDSEMEKVPVIKIETVVNATVTGYLNDYQMKATVNVHSFCFNSSNRCWEPLIELSTKDDINYKPWELNIKMCHGQTHPIDPTWVNPCQRIQQDETKNRGKSMESSESTDMVFIGPDKVSSKVIEKHSYSEYEDSDTDDEENQKKIARSFRYLFDNDSSTEEDNDDSDNSSINEDEESEEILDCNMELVDNTIYQEPEESQNTAIYFIIHSEDVLNFTVTPNTIRVVKNILDTFVQAKNGIPIVPTSTEKLILQNDIGHESRVELLLQKEISGKKVTLITAKQTFGECISPPTSAPSSPEKEETAWIDFMDPGWISEYEFPDPDVKEQNYSMEQIFCDESPVQIYKTITEELLQITVEGFENISLYCPKRAGCTLLPLRPVRHDVRYHLVIEIAMNSYLHRTISVRSPLQFRNETMYPLGLYYKKHLLEKWNLPYIGEAVNPFDDNIRMAVIAPDSTYSIPLYIAYHFPIHILPACFEKYEVSDDGIYWKDLNDTRNRTQDIYCKANDNRNRGVFGIKAIETELSLATRPGCHVPNYLISIVPLIIFNNQLPFVLDINIPSIDYSVKIEPGEKINMHSLRCDSETQFNFKIQSYLGTQWTGTITVNSNMESKLVLMSAESERDSAKPFVLCVDLYKNRSWDIVIKAQYWIINKSGLPLLIQDCYSHIIYEIPKEQLMVFSQRSNKRNMVRMRAQQSEWSSPFELDGISSMSLIVCKDSERGRKYRILTKIENSRLSPLFTKILTFLPYFVVSNKTGKTLRFMEENDQADLWNDLQCGEDSYFWPITESMRMRVKWKNSQLVSQHFNIMQIGKTVLRMDNGSALCVEIKGGTSSPYRVVFTMYEPGNAPVRIDNLCDKSFLKINQANLGQVTLLNPFQSLLYTWDDPTKPREIIWNVYNSKSAGFKAQFETDGYGHEEVSFITVERYCNEGTDNENVETQSTKSEKFKEDKMIVYWVSYVDDGQRVLLLTQYENSFLKVKSLIDPELSNKEIFFSLAGIGLSVVSESNNVTRELIHGSILNSAAHWEVYFGKKWKNLSLELSAWIESLYTSSSKKAQLANFIEVDLVKMHMSKPFFGKLRRTYSPGIWLSCRMSNTLTSLQGYVHRIQVDNQLPEATFPVVINSNLDKSIIDYAGTLKLKHCIEFTSLKQEKSLHYSVYKGISVLVRDFHVNLQEEFLSLLSDLIPKRAETKYSIAAKLRKDISSIHMPLFHGDAINDSNETGKDLIEHLYISPIVIYLKLQAKTERYNFCNSSTLNERFSLVKYIFQYAQNGIFEKQAVFRLPYYSRKFISFRENEIVSDIRQNYTVQIMQQFRVLIQSVTVLGNKYSYNFKEPGDLFYEPNLLITRDDEITEKLCYDVSCYLGHATPDALQTSSFNFDHFKSHNIHMKENTFCSTNKDVPPLTLTLNNSFCTEIELELSALVKTSLNNIHEEELKYFFKTLNKKISLFKIENTNSRSFSRIITDIMQRAQETGHKFIYRIRLPRYVNPYTGVELLSMHKAKGVHLLNTTNKNHYAQTDTYWAHTALSNDGKSIALVSLRRVYFLEKGIEWGSWDVKWSIETNQLLSPPSVINNKLVLHINKNEDPTSSVVDWYLESKNADVLEWLCRKINIAMILNMESSVCSKED